MPDNDVVINPDPAPAPPAPAPPAPSPKTAVDVESVRRDIGVFLNVAHGVKRFLPASVRGTTDKFLAVLDTVATQDWAAELLALVLNKVSGDSTPEDVQAAFAEALAVQGEQAKTQ